MIKRTLKDWLSELQKQTGPGRKRRSQKHLSTNGQANHAEQMETRLLLTTIDYTDTSLPAGRMYGDQAEVEFTGQTPERSFNDGMSGPNRPAYFRTTGVGRPSTNPGGTQYNTYVLNWDFVKPRANGGTVPAVNRDDDPNSERNIRVTIDETVPFNAAQGREVMRVINLPNQFSARWQRVNENGTRVDLDTENAGSDNQVGRDFEVRPYMTQQFRTVIRNGQNEIVRTIEWRRLTTSNLKGTLSAPSQIQQGQNADLTFNIQNVGNLPYTNGGQVRYLVTASASPPTFQQLLNSPNRTGIPSIVNSSTILGATVSGLGSGDHFIHWVIDTDEAPDWRYDAPNGSGSGASVRERDSFANKNFPIEANNNPIASARIRVVQSKSDPVINPPARVAVNEGTFVSRNFTAFDPDGGPVVRVDASLGDVFGTSPNFVWNYQANDNRPEGPISLTATDDEGMMTTKTFQLIVDNVAPTLSLTTNSPLEEGGTAILNGTYFDPGVLDTHTVTIDWGDGTVQTNLSVSGGAFSFSHQYTDDNAADRYDATVTIVDKDGGATTQTIPIVVTNVAPIVDVEITSDLDENGVAILTGSILDPGTDSFNATIDWGDGTSTVLPLAAGTTEFTTTHQYLDDGPSPGNGTSFDDYAVVVTVTDDDGDSGSANAVTTVNNVAPVIRGTPAFSAPQFIVTGTNDILGFDVADIDGDGDLDLASASRLDNRVAWYPNDGNGNFAQINLQPFDDTIVPRLADFDADGDIDLIASAVDGRSIRLYENDGNQNFTARTILANVRANQLRVADLNGDSTLDIAYGSQDGQLGVLINSGTATFTNQPLMSQLGVVRDIHIDDVDQDGLADIMVAARATSSNSASNLLLLTNTGNFSFQTTTLRSDSGVVFAGVNTLDVDNDGDTDIVGTDETNDAVYLYNNTGGVFAESQLPSTVDGPNFATPSDVDGDGDIDLLVSGVLDDSVSFLRNDGTGTFEEFSAATGIDGARNITVADIDGDGSQEILVDSRFGDGIVAFEYLGEQLPALSAINEGQAATLTAEYFDVGTLDAHKVTVDWGDGNVDTDVPVSNGTINTTHVYADDGPTDSYQILVTLTDDDLGVSTAATTIVVQNVAPSAELISISDLRVEGTEIVVAADATDPGVNDVLTFRYEILKDGVAYVAGEGIDQREFRFTPDDDGEYTISLTVTDDDGGEVNVTEIITVENVGPTVGPFADMVIQEGDSVTLDLTNIVDPGDDTVSEIRIDWGDGLTEAGLPGPGLYSHTYNDGPDMHQISVTLVDEDGEWTGTGPSVSDYLNAVANTPSLLSRYELDGNIDDSLAQRNGVIAGNPGFVPGLVGNAIQASNGNYGHIQPGTSYVPHSDSFSTSMHFLLDQPSAPLNWAPLLVMQQSDFSEGFLLQLGTTNLTGDTLNLVLHGGPKGSNDFQVIQHVFSESQLGEWHHAGFTVDRDSGTASLYFDGELLVSETLTVSSLDPTKGMFIGQYDFTFGRNGHPRFVGGDSMLLDEVLLFDGALSAEQIEPLSLIGGSSFTKKVTVLNVDPTANDDTFDVLEDDGTVSLNVLENDTDPAGAFDPLQVTSINTMGTIGEATLTATGVDYSPNGQFEFLAVGETATDTFTYTIDDGDGGTSTATVTITVTGENDAPTANPDFASTTENASVTTDVIANDADPDVTDVLSLVPNTSFADATADFSLAQNPNGQWSYHSSDDTVRDGDYPLLEETAPLEIPGGGPIVWHADSTSASIRPFVGVKTFNAPGLGSWQNGELAIHPGRSQRMLGPGLVVLTYTAESDGTANIDFDLQLALNGNVLWFVEKNDSTGTLASGSIAGNGATASIDLDSVPVLAGDRINLVIDSNGSVGSDLIRILRGEIEVVSPPSFTMTLDSDGSTIPVRDATVSQNGNALTFDPANDLDFLAAGETATVVVDYTVSDNNGATDDGTLTITVTGENDAPTANPDFASTTENASVTTDVIANDTDPDATDILSLVDGSSIASMTLDIDGSTIPLGDASLSQSGNEITFDPGTDFDFLATGETATVTVDYTVSDDAASPLTDDGTLTITVVGTNDAPVANDIVGQVNEDEPAVVVAADFTDADVTDTHAFDIDTSATAGSVINNGDGTFSYDPAGQFESLAAGESATDTFTYTVDDGFGGIAMATATVTVVGQNDDPVAFDIMGTANEDGPAVTIAADFSDVDTSDTHTFDVDTTGTTGIVINNGDGTFSYAPNGQFESLAVGETATDTFLWTVTDSNGASSQAIAIITVVGSNDAPQVTVESSNPTVENKSDNGWVTVTGTFTDLDISDEHEVVIDWGDGTTSSATVDQLGDTFSGMHDYTDGGIYEITVTIDDGNGGIDTQTTQAVVTGTGLVDGVLYIIGSDSKDSVRVRTYHHRIKVQTSIGHRRHEYNSYSVADVQKVVVITCGANDHIDVLTPSHIPVHVEAGDGRDHIWTANGKDFIDGGKGKDKIWSYGGDDTIFAGAGDDHVWAGSGDDVIDAGAGRDNVFASYGNDIIYGREGMDDINAGDGDDIVFGGSGADWLSGDDGNDFIDGGSGNDMIKGGRGHDVLVGGTGRDQIFAGHGNDLLIGGSLSIDWESQDDLSDVDEAMMAWATGDLTQTLDLLGNVEDDNTPDKLFGERGYDTILHGRRDWWRY